MSRPPNTQQYSSNPYCNSGLIDFSDGRSLNIEAAYTSVPATANMSPYVTQNPMFLPQTLSTPVAPAGFTLVPIAPTTAATAATPVPSGYVQVPLPGAPMVQAAVPQIPNELYANGRVYKVVEEKLEAPAATPATTESPVELSHKDIQRHVEQKVQEVLARSQGRMMTRLSSPITNSAPKAMAGTAKPTTARDDFMQEMRKLNTNVKGKGGKK